MISSRTMQADVVFTDSSIDALSLITNEAEIRDLVADEPLIGLCLTENNAAELTTPSFTAPLFAISSGILAGFVDLQDLNTRLTYTTPEVVQRVWNRMPDRRPMLYCIERSRVTILHWFNERVIDLADVRYLCSLGVRRSFRLRGVATGLVERQLDVARKMGAKYVVVETTGNGSRRIFQKLGGQEINFVSYDQMSKDLECRPIRDHIGFATFVVIL